MEMAMLQIHQQMAQLQIEIELGQLKMDLSCRRGMQVTQESANMDTDIVQPEVQVDLGAYRYRTGMKTSHEFSQDNASRAQQIAVQGVEQIASDRNYVAKTLPQGGNAIGQLAMQHMLNDSTVPFQTYSQVPPNVVDVTVKEGQVDINSTAGNFSIDWDRVAAPTLSFDPPPSVDVYVARKPQLEFQVVKMEIPPEMPGEIDETA